MGPTGTTGAEARSMEARWPGPYRWPRCYWPKASVPILSDGHGTVNTPIAESMPRCRGRVSDGRQARTWEDPR